MFIALDINKMRTTPIPTNLKKRWMKAGGIDNPEYKVWVEQNWKQEGEFKLYNILAVNKLNVKLC